MEMETSLPVSHWVCGPDTSPRLPGPHLSHFCILMRVDEALAFPNLGSLACKMSPIITHSTVARPCETTSTKYLVMHPGLSQ